MALVSQRGKRLLRDEYVYTVTLNLLTNLDQQMHEQ